MNALVPRLLIAALFLGAASPALAQALPGVPPAIWAQVEALGPVLPMVIENGALYTQLCHRDNQCPVMYRFLMHDHISAPTGINTGDESVSTPLLNFIKAR
jgi:hypothetical protein